jgi:anti-sigma28 factor (negative regulator of flagellin synthesis)
MRIESKTPLEVPIVSKETAVSAAPSTVPSAAASRVQLSAAGAAASAAEPTSPAWSARVESLRTQVQSGQYSVDLDQLASKIVGDDGERSGRA